MKLIRNALSATIAVTALSSPAIIIAEESSRTIEEIVVTSRRRDESVQDVPLSVTAFGEERIEQLKLASVAQRASTKVIADLKPNAFA